MPGSLFGSILDGRSLSFQSWPKNVVEPNEFLLPHYTETLTPELEKAHFELCAILLTLEIQGVLWYMTVGVQKRIRSHVRAIREKPLITMLGGCPNHNVQGGLGK